MTSPDDSPHAMFDEFRNHPEWTERDRDVHLGRIIERFPLGAVVETVLTRLSDLGEADAEPLLRLVEANPSAKLSEALARALLSQPDLPVDRAWDALAILDANGVLEDFPELFERWNELNESLDDEGSMSQLVDQLDGDPEGVWLALQGLGGIEPEIRAEIVAGLAHRTPGPGVVEFLRLLAYSHDPATRSAALGILLDDTVTGAIVRDAQVDLADHHPDSIVSARAAEVARLGSVESSHSSLVKPRPRLVRSLVTAIDGHGRGSVVLSALRGADCATVAFLCQVNEGVIDVVGDISRDAEAAFEDFAEGFTGDFARDVPDFAVAILSGSVLVSGRKAPPVTRFWLEATIGPGFRARPFQADREGLDPESIRHDEVLGRTNEVLEACPDWRDRSRMTFEMAEELFFREPANTPDPTRHASLYRYLFEHRLRGQIEKYRRMLLWMTGLWEATGDEELARSGLVLALQLSDAQHVVPGHPFIVGITTRSLISAQDDLRAGRDPR